MQELNLLALNSKFFLKNETKHKVISPKHHQGNGLAERYIQTVKKLLKKKANL